MNLSERKRRNKEIDQGDFPSPCSVLCISVFNLLLKEQVIAIARGRVLERMD